MLRFSAFNQRTTPELNGTVARVGADTSTDQRTGQSYYLVRIAMTADEINRLGDVKLTPGMPVEAFIQTGERTLRVLSGQAVARPADALHAREVSGAEFSCYNG